MFRSSTLVLLMVLTGARASFADSTDQADPAACSLLLAAHLIDPARTYLVEGGNGRYAEMNRYRFGERVLEYRRVVTEFRRLDGPSNEEFLVHLDRRILGGDGLGIKTYLVTSVYEEDITYDYNTGEVGTGRMGGTVFRTGGVRIRFELDRHPDVTRYELHRMHDELIPLIQTRLNEVNLAAKRKFGHSLWSPIIHRYPGEYEAFPAQSLTPAELAYVIDALVASAPRAEPSGDGSANPVSL